MTVSTKEQAARPHGRVLILGIGNILWADEGFGVRVVEYLAARHHFPAPAELMDGGTQGLYLLPQLEGLDGLVIVDAIDFGLPPGTVHTVRGADVPSTIGARKMSLHQTGFQEVLALLDLRGHAPRKVALIGVQPVNMQDYGGGLTPPVAARVPEVAAAVLAMLAEDYDIHPIPRAPDATQDGAGLMTAAVSRTAYENGRPTEAEACRYGDPRVLTRMGG
ncbi:MAG: HyaD/HybD family hydrogenase maturation endopeptidase [Acetobacter papayae]